MQVPRRIHTEGLMKSAVWAIAGTSWRDVSNAGAAQKESDRRGPLAGQSRAHDDLDIVDVRGVQRGGYIKEKSAIHLARVYGERKRNFTGQCFWARGYFVSTVGRDESVIRNCNQNQEKEDERLEQLGLWR